MPLPHNQQIIVEEAGLVLKETLVERVDHRDVAPVMVVQLVAARILPHFVFGQSCVRRGEHIPHESIMRQIIIIN